MAANLTFSAMASIDQVIQQIRFALENLSERNGQHEFEHLCRHFARHRVCFNILPATGPVGGGGDQGRDFETFRTFIYGLGNDKFAAHGENKKLAFACSLQKQPEKSKIRGDVKSIVSGTQRPDVIYFFSSRSVAVAARHKLQSWAKKTHKVELEIVDAEALAEQLAYAEVFWIAARYLSVPLEIFPTMPDANDQYKTKKESWSKSTGSPSRYSDFVELKRCARYALGDAPQDIPFWLGLLAKYEKSQVGEVVWPQAAYELIVLNARQTRSLRGQEDRIRRFVSEAKCFQYPDEVENTATIMTYVVAMHRLGEVDMDATEIQREWLELRDKIEKGIQNPLSPNQLCLWLEVRSHLSFAGGVTKETLPDITETLSWWLRVAEECPNAPTFPVQQFHDQLFDYMELIGERPEFDTILAKLRPEIAKRTGDAALAESHFKRAEQFSKQKQYARAIRELHDARVKWFSEETLDQSLYCCVLLARSYSHLNMHYAAIYYALAAGFIVANSPRPSLADKLCDCLASAACAAYAQGHWCLFSGLTESLLILHNERAPNPGSLNEHEHLQWLVGNLPMAALVIQRLLPSHFDNFFADLRRWGFGNLTEEGMKAIRPPFDKWSDADFSRALRKNFTGPPFSDAGNRCEAVWSALGIRWRIRWDNSYEALKVAGETVAFLQIAITEFAGCDLDVVPGELQIDIELTSDARITIESLPDNSAYLWRIRVPRAPKPGRDGMNEVAEQMLVCVIEIVRAFSVMSSERFKSETILESGMRIYGHAVFARRFPELIGFFLPDPGFRSDLRKAIKCPVKLDKWTPAVSPELEWVNSIHSRFDEDAELKRIRIRYDKAIPSLRLTLKRLARDSDFRSTLEALRAKGWKDWHVLQALSNTAANYRSKLKLGDRPEEAAFKRVFIKELFAEETADSPVVPLERFSRLELEFNSLMVISSSMMKHMGLEPYHTTPNVDGIREYLRHRWRYWDLDVEHPPVFDSADHA